ncbi:hypothetical protein ACHAQJ_009121 [Trichoderma viride]
MPDLTATAPTVVGLQTSPVTEEKQLAATESVDADAGSTSPALVQSKPIHTVCACHGRDAISKQTEEAPNQLPMVSLESSEVGKPTRGAVKRLRSPTRLHAPPYKRIRLADSSDHQAPSQEDSSISTATSPLSIPHFASCEPNKGPPSLSWENFRYPQLRRFSGSFTTYNSRYVGDGVDGLVFKTKTDGGETVAVKIFYNAEPPKDFEGLYCYWAFKRECRNGALLGMITARLEQATANSKSVYLDPNPSTREDAIRNLKSFSAESSDNHPEHFEPFTLETHINPCHGWTVVDGLDINKRLHKSRGIPALQDRQYFAIVYDYVSKGKLQDEAVQAQLDFFYLSGFICLPVEERNWRGSGTLVDFSDLLAPHSPMWRGSRYGRMVKTERGLYTILRPVQKPPEEQSSTIKPEFKKN